MTLCCKYISDIISEMTSNYGIVSKCSHFSLFRKKSSVCLFSTSPFKTAYDGLLAVYERGMQHFYLFLSRFHDAFPLIIWSFWLELCFWYERNSTLINLHFNHFKTVNTLVSGNASEAVWSWATNLNFWRWVFLASDNYNDDKDGENDLLFLSLVQRPA